MADCFVEPLCGIESHNSRGVESHDITPGVTGDVKSDIDINTVGLPVINEENETSSVTVQLMNGHVEKMPKANGGTRRPVGYEISLVSLMTQHPGE